jgi:primosomal protein N'
MTELTPEQENYLEEQAREKYLEEKHKKGLVECKFCGFEHSKDISCPECERQLFEYNKEK